MSLSSSSTLAEVEAQYDDNASYDLSGSVASCKLFIEAARLLLRRMADEVQAGGGSRVRQERSVIQQQLDDARRWWMSNDPNAGIASGAASSVREISFEEFR
jgi:hypothetical protein